MYTTRTLRTICRCSFVVEKYMVRSTYDEYFLFAASAFAQ